MLDALADTPDGLPLLAGYHLLLVIGSCYHVLLPNRLLLRAVHHQFNLAYYYIQCKHTTYKSELLPPRIIPGSQRYAPRHQCVVASVMGDSGTGTTGAGTSSCRGAAEGGPCLGGDKERAGHQHEVVGTGVLHRLVERRWHRGHCLGVTAAGAHLHGDVCWRGGRVDGSKQRRALLSVRGSVAPPRSRRGRGRRWHRARGGGAGGGTSHG